MPSTLGGLAVTEEPKATQTLKEISGRSYVAEGWVYSLRDSGELKALLQISRLTPSARPDDADWRRRIVGQIGGRVSKPVKIAGVLVYSGRQTEQTVNIWFRDGFMLVLAVRDDPEAEGTTPGFDPTRTLEEAAALRAA